MKKAKAKRGKQVKEAKPVKWKPVEKPGLGYRPPAPKPSIHDEVLAALRAIVGYLETTGHRDEVPVVAAREVITQAQTKGD